MPGLQRAEVEVARLGESARRWLGVRCEAPPPRGPLRTDLAPPAACRLFASFESASGVGAGAVAHS
jgi:hypothetical protein